MMKKNFLKAAARLLVFATGANFLTFSLLVFGKLLTPKDLSSLTIAAAMLLPALFEISYAESYGNARSTKKIMFNQNYKRLKLNKLNRQIKVAAASFIKFKKAPA